jgi:hypothetical protein
MSLTLPPFRENEIVRLPEPRSNVWWQTNGGLAGRIWIGRAALRDIRLLELLPF